MSEARMILRENIRRALHSQPNLHRMYKFIKSMRSIPMRKLFNLDMHQISWSVITHTMLPIGRMYATIGLVKDINRSGIGGDIVECGVWSGGGLGLMALSNERFDWPRRYVGFDSFEGLPAPTLEDADVFEKYSNNRPVHEIVSETDKAVRTAISACVGAKRPEVLRFLVEELCLPQDRVELVSGWFADTVPAWASSDRKIALLRIDGDWYESTLVCLEHLYELVEPGGIVTIDDYGAFSGCKRAVNEFLERRELGTPLRYIDNECVWFRVK